MNNSTPDAKPVQLVLSRLGEFKQTLGGYQARCPAHDDNRASLTISEGEDGKAMLHCHAGCEPAAVVKALGIGLADLFPVNRNGKRHGEIVTAYDYADEAGTLLFQAVRYEPKTFKQRAPKPEGGWTWSTKGVRQVVYRLPELLAADPQAVVFIPEGEKDVENIRKRGGVATCNAMGAGKWRAAFAQFFVGRRVVILPDNDDVGRKHADDVGRSLTGKAASIKVVELPGLPEKGDVSDWFAAGGTVDELLRIVDSAPEWTERKPQVMSCGNSLSLLSPDGRTDVANGKRFAKLHGDKFRWCEVWKKGLVWDGQRWKIDDERRADALAKDVYQAMWKDAATVSRDAGEELKDVMRFLHKTGAANGIASMVTLAKSEPGIPISPSELDIDPWLFNVANGTIDLRTGQIREHRREDRLTKLCPVKYDRAADCPQWIRFLNDVTGGNSELQDYLRKAVGCSLTGVVREHLLFFLYGVGANGKSTFINTVATMMGDDYAMKAAPDLLLVKSNDSHPTERADLHGKRFVACVEAGEARRLAESLVKEITGGDTIRARRMREDFWQFNPTHKIWLAANHKPVIRGTDVGIWRRIKLVPFTAVFDDKQQDKQLAEKLAKEFSGILNWALWGCAEWQKNGLVEPRVVLEATGQYRRQQDVLGGFLDECCIIGPDVRAEPATY